MNLENLYETRCVKTNYSYKENVEKTQKQWQQVSFSRPSVNTAR